MSCDRDPLSTARGILTGILLVVAFAICVWFARCTG